MRYEELVYKARQIARPCTLLKHEGPPDLLAGVWGGPGIVAAGPGPFRHWLSVDCRFLPPGLGPKTGVLSVYSNEEDCVSGVAAYDPAAGIAVASASPLYAHRTLSLPPPDALPECDDEYMSLWQANCPLYTGEAAAMLGGWHFPWPNGDWQELREQILLVWTFEESEPWVEVWRTDGGYRVMQRVT